MSATMLGNPNLRDALKTAEELGCGIRDKPGQGESVISHPRWSRPITINNRRKDTPRVLVVAIRRLLLARDEERQIDMDLVQEAVDDAAILTACADPEPEFVEIDAATVERQSKPVVGEERVTLEEAAALIERPVGTTRAWIVRDKLDVGYNHSDQTIAAAGLDILDHLSRSRLRRRRGEGAKYLPELAPEPASPPPTRIVPMAASTGPQPTTAPPTSLVLTDEDRALAQALGLTPEAFIRLCVDQTAKRLREKLRALLTEAA